MLGPGILALALFAMALPNRYGITSFHEANTAGHVYTVQSWVHFGTWSLAPILCRTGPQHDIVDKSVRDGEPLLQKAPGLSWLAMVPYQGLVMLNGGVKLPFHWTAMVLALICALLPVALVAIGFYKALKREIAPRYSLLPLLALLLASPIFTYSGMFQDVAPAALLLFGGYLLLAGQRRPAGLVAAGFVIAAAGAINYSYLLFGLVVALVDLARRIIERDGALAAVGLAALGALPVMSALAVYHEVMWGSPLATAYDYLVDPGQIRHHESIGFAWATMGRTLVGPKQGFLFHAPWTAFGLLGLGILAARPASRWRGVTGIAVVLTVVLFTSVMDTNNYDSMPFGRYSVAVYPWLALGLAGLLGAGATSASAGWKWLVPPLVVATIAGGAVYQFATAWTYPYHHPLLASPLWQLNLPLLLNGAHLPPVLLSIFRPWFVPGVEGMEGYPVWVAIGAATMFIALGAAALVSVRTPRRRRLPAVAIGIAAFLVVLFAGHQSVPVPSQVRERVATMDLRADQVPPELHEVVRQARIEARLYEAALTDIKGSAFTPQDVSWRDAGYPETNPWCSP